MVYIKASEATRWGSQKDLADKLGITVNHLKYYINTGKCKSVKMFGRLLVDSNFKIETRKNKLGKGD
jgi:DNA-binding Xre family transcriptional regulator